MAGLLTTQAVQLLIGATALGVFLLSNRMPAGGWIVVLELSIYVVGWTASYTFFIPAPCIAIDGEPGDHRSRLPPDARS